MMEPMASIQSERGEVKRAAQAFRDLAVLLVLLLLVFSVRWNDDGGEPAVQPLPDGVQAAGHDSHDPSQPPVVEPASVPALATPEPARETETAAAPVAVLRELARDVETEARVLVLRDGTLHEIRLPARWSVKTTGTCDAEPEVDVFTRS
jgi:hypothetical protein